MNRYLNINIFVLFTLFVMTENSYACIELPWAMIYDPNTPYSQTVCKGIDVEFNGSWSEGGTYEIDEWKWVVEKWTGAVYVPYNTFYGEEAYFAFSDPAKYQITLTVKDEEGNPSPNSDTCYVYVVEVASVTSYVAEACDGINVTFEVTTNPPGYESLVSWSGGGTPWDGSGSTFITKWYTGGTKTVTASCGTSSKSKQVNILAGCDCTLPGEDWLTYFPIGDCNLYNGPADEEELPDDCNNTIKQDCSGGSGSYAYHWYYNDSDVGSCIWHNGYNRFQYRYTQNYDRYHSTRHSTLHRCNSISCMKYPSGRYGCADSKYYCWKFTYYDCLDGVSFIIWRRSTSYPGDDIWNEDGVPCPDGAHH